MICSCGGRSKKECQEAFDSLLAKDFSDFRYGRAHRLVVDTYSLQHPEKYMISPKSFAAHLTGMCCAMEHENDQDLPRLLQKWLNGKKQLDKPELLGEMGDLTISHIIGAADGSEHIKLVQEWARDVWSAYSIYHDLARNWIRIAQREASSELKHSRTREST